jgi:hypothetical protein
MNDSSTAFQHKIESSARQIEQIDSIEQLSPLLREVIDASRAMADETASGARSTEQPAIASAGDRGGDRQVASGTAQRQRLGAT